MTQQAPSERCSDFGWNGEPKEKKAAMPFQIPAHACDPPVRRDDPRFQRVIRIAVHGYPEEIQLRSEIEDLVSGSGEPITIQYMGMRDADLYLIVTIGVGIATNLITDLIKYLAKRIRAELESRQRPVIYISSSYAPKKVFRLPEEENEAQEHFLLHPSRDSNEATIEEK